MPGSLQALVWDMCVSQILPLLTTRPILVVLGVVQLQARPQNPKETLELPLDLTESTLLLSQLSQLKSFVKMSRPVYNYQLPDDHYGVPHHSLTGAAENPAMSYSTRTSQVPSSSMTR